MKTLTLILIFCCISTHAFCQNNSAITNSESHNPKDEGSLIDDEKYHFEAVLKYYSPDSIVYYKLLKKNGLVSYQNEPGDVKIIFYNDDLKNVFEYNLFSPYQVFKGTEALEFIKKNGTLLKIDLPKQCEFHQFTYQDLNFPELLYTFRVQNARFKDYESKFISSL